MSILVDDAQLISGSFTVREIGSLGVRGADLVPGSYLYVCADLPADNDKEFRGEVLSHNFPQGFFEYYDDGSIVVLEGCPAGVYSYTFRLSVDGVALTPLITNPVYVGQVMSLGVNAALAPLDASIAFEVAVPGTLGISAELASVSPLVNLSTTATLGVLAELAPITSLVFFYGNLVGQLPPLLNRARQVKAIRDENLNAYSAVRSFRWQWEKDPQARLDWSIDWTDVLDGDLIADLFVSKSEGLTIDAQGVTGGGRVTGVMVQGGVVGTLESITFRIATRDGRVDERTIVLVIRQR